MEELALDYEVGELINPVRIIEGRNHPVAVILTNYNMPERADAIAEHLEKYCEWPYDLYLVDNGSDLVPPAENTTVFLPENVQTTGGWLAGLQVAKDSPVDYFAYWLMITSMEFPFTDDVLTYLMEYMLEDDELVGIHPALTDGSTTAWGHLKVRVTDEFPRRTWMIDNIAALWRADWFDEIGWFDPEMIYGWGVDLETCYRAREQGKKLAVDDCSVVEKITDIGYTMERMNMTATDRRVFARANMTEVLSRKYGPDWEDKMRNEYVEDEWR